MDKTALVASYLKGTGRTITEVVKLMEIGRNTFYYQLNKDLPDETFIEKFNKVTNSDLVQILNKVSTDALTANELKSLHPNQDPGAPYFESVTASAGLSYLTDNSHSMPTSYIKIPGAGVDGYINVFGDSMYPKYCSGEIIGVKRIDKELVFFGNAYVVEMIDGEAYIKYIREGKDQEHWSLESENEKFDPQQFHLSKISRVFKIKTVITKTAL